MLHPLTLPRFAVGMRVYIKGGPYQGRCGTVRRCRGLCAIVRPDVAVAGRIWLDPLIADCVPVHDAVGTAAWRARLIAAEGGPAGSLS